MDSLYNNVVSGIMPDNFNVMSGLRPDANKTNSENMFVDMLSGFMPDGGTTMSDNVRLHA